MTNFTRMFCFGWAAISAFVVALMMLVPNPDPNASRFDGHFWGWLVSVTLCTVWYRAMTKRLAKEEQEQGAESEEADVQARRRIKLGGEK